ncbi:MAG: HD domain-containing protein [Sulfurimonas sp.]|nr:HD domain-containing protein [Sulfurimonas sp.]
MKIKSLKFYVIIMFLIPSAALIYFSYLYLQNEYKIKKDALRYRQTIEQVSILGELIHSLQLERGLSVGYIISNEKNIKEKLSDQYIKTDNCIAKLKTMYQKEILLFNINVKKSIDKLHNLKGIRYKTLDLSYSFEDVVLDYYANLNTKLIIAIKNINQKYIHIHNDLGSLENILKLKEYAGLERAFIYSESLLNDNSKYARDIKRVRVNQKILKDVFLFNASKSSLKIFTSLYSNEIVDSFKECSANKFLKNDAQKCFSLSTKYINVLNSIYQGILEQYRYNSKLFYKEALNSLIITALVLIISILILLILIYLFVKLIYNEEKFHKELEDTQKEIIYKMGEIGESRSQETGNHVKRVAKYSRLLALLSGLDEKNANLIYTASPMHDIGKVAISDSILKKPGKLTDEEWVVMQSHSEIGYKILKDSSRPIFKTAAIVSYQHHEKWDGSGYPNKLKGEEIHIFGRITALADVFDALGSDRCYKKAWDLEKILNLFKEEKGKHFDPKLVELFLNNLDKFLLIRNKFQDMEII